MYIVFLLFLVKFSESRVRLEPTKELFKVCSKYDRLDYQLSAEPYRMGTFEHELGFLWLILLPILAIIVHLLSGPGMSSITAAGLACGATYFLAEMQSKRKILREIAGNEFKDDEWGFGQVLAIFVWIPVCVAMVCVLFRVSDVAN